MGTSCPIQVCDLRNDPSSYRGPGFLKITRVGTAWGGGQASHLLPIKIVELFLKGLAGQAVISCGAAGKTSLSTGTEP